MSPSTRSKIDAALLVGILVGSPVLGHAEPEAGPVLRLRGDALAETKSPVGLLVLRGEDKLRPWLDVETVTWAGARTGGALEPAGDVLTLSIRARDVKSGSEIRAGRMVVTMGAVRPVQIDGVRATGRAFGGTTVEAFGGAPVVRLDQASLGRPFDWTAGGRFAQGNDAAVAGVSYSVRKRGASADEEEGGVDVAITPARWFTAAGRAAFDLLTRGPTDALVSVSAQKSDLRAEVFATHRSPGRLLPSTSLFSVLGDFPATTSGSTLRWRAFPRLELLATGSVQTQASDVGGQGLGRSTLAFDDAWQSAVGVEVRHVDFAGARWTGIRTTLTLPLGGAFHGATELELVRTRTDTWPWALASVAWRPRRPWEVAAGIEASASPMVRSSVQALARASYAFDDPPRRSPR